jgi:hypothetical protein
MKEQIQQKIESWVGEDIKDSRLDDGFYVPKSEIELVQISKSIAHNQALQDLRTKAPQLAQEIVDMVVEEIEKWKTTR